MLADESEQTERFGSTEQLAEQADQSGGSTEQVDEQAERAKEQSFLLEVKQVCRGQCLPFLLTHPLSASLVRFPILTQVWDLLSKNVLLRSVS